MSGVRSAWLCNAALLDVSFNSKHGYTHECIVRYVKCGGRDNTQYCTFRCASHSVATFLMVSVTSAFLNISCWLVAWQEVTEL